MQAARQQLERIPRRQAHPIVTSNSSNLAAASSTGITQQPPTLISASSIHTRDAPISTSSQLPFPSSNGTSLQSQKNQSQFLLARFMNPSFDETELAQLECDRADR